jgi:hypothetical protein
VLIYRGLFGPPRPARLLFLYLAPFFVVLGSRWFIPGDRFHPSQWLGLALSFVGIVIAFGLPTPAADPHQMLGDIMMVGAAAAWAATTLVIKASALNRVSAEKTCSTSSWFRRRCSPSRPSCLANTSRDAVGAGIRRRFLSGGVGGERHLRGLVCAHRALFGQADCRLLPS